MNNGVIIPAQIRAARALLGWSQEQLANEAEVGLGTVRDIESEKRGADSGAVESIRRALWNGGVVFVAGRQDEGPGVRLVANRPNIIRRPTTMQKWEGMPFGIEWQGKAVTVLVAFDVIDDLGRHQGNTPDDAYLKTFERHRGQILDAVTLAIVDPQNFDQFGRVYIRQKDIDAAKSGQWHQVTIDSGEDIRDIEARELMNKFASRFIQSGIPNNVEVFHDKNADGGHIYYFSPMASEIAKDLLALFHASPCASQSDSSSARKVKI
jgi:transcriptional regulator with XRE-family HTH domain